MATGKFVQSGLMVMLLLTLTNIAAAQEVPFVGVVTNDNTPVRAGAGQPFYVVGELDQGKVVNVREVIVGWHRIDAPQGVYSFVPKMNVDLESGGSIGVVNAARTPVTAARSQGTGSSYQTQLELGPGVKVQIIDERGSFYKIKPPEGATVFLAPGTVRPATRAELIRFREEQKPKEQSPAASTEETDESSSAADQPSADQPQMPSPPGVPTGPGPVILPEDKPQPTQPAEPEAADVTGAVSSSSVGSTTTTTSSTNPTTSSQSQTQTTQQPQSTTAASETDVDVQRHFLLDTNQPDTEAENITGTASTETEEVTTVETQTMTMQVGKGVETPSAAESSSLAQVESQMLPLFMRPVEEQPIDEMQAAYETVLQDPQLSASDRQIVKLRLMALERNRELATALQRIADARQRTEQAAVQAREAEQQMIAQAERDQPPVRYDLRGVLESSTVYDGVNLPRMFRLVDPQTGRTIGYVHPGNLGETARAFVGRTVGIQGDVTYDETMKLNLIHVDDIRAIN